MGVKGHGVEIPQELRQGDEHHSISWPITLHYFDGGSPYFEG